MFTSNVRAVFRRQCFVTTVTKCMLLNNVTPCWRLRAAKKQDMYSSFTQVDGWVATFSTHPRWA